jgi:hypothetical protein
MKSKRAKKPTASVSPDSHTGSFNDQQWARLEGLASAFAKAAQTSPSAINHDALAATLMACTAILRASVRRGQHAGIQSVVMAADLLAVEVERAHQLYPEELRKITPRLSTLPIRMSLPESSFSSARRMLMETGTGTKSIPPTATKVQAGSTWSKLAQAIMADILFLREILATDQRARSSSEHIHNLTAKYLPKAKILGIQLSDLPPLSKSTVPEWWKVGKVMLKVHWQHAPDEAKNAFAEVRMSADEAGETHEAFATRRAREAFYALVG